MLQKFHLLRPFVVTKSVQLKDIKVNDILQMKTCICKE